jgi:hypothetical protein
MPVATFQVKPTTDASYRSGDKATSSGDNEAENFEEIRAILVQLGNVANHATAMFQDLFNETSATTERVERLSHTVEKKIFATDQESNYLQFIENRIVLHEEPMRLYETAGKQPKPLPQTELEGNLFAKESMPAGLEARYRSQTDADMDFSAVDALSEGFGTDEFREAGLMYSNPNAFNEMYFEGLADQAKAEKAKKKEKKKAARDRKKSIKGEKKSDAKRVRKRQIDKDTGLEMDDPAEIAFKKIDTDGNGILDLAELTMAFGHLEQAEFNLSEEQVQDAMARMDLDGDGKVTMEEFAVSLPASQGPLPYISPRPLCMRHAARPGPGPSPSCWCARRLSALTSGGRCCSAAMCTELCGDGDDIAARGRQTCLRPEARQLLLRRGHAG